MKFHLKAMCFSLLSFLSFVGSLVFLAAGAIGYSEAGQFLGLAPEPLFLVLAAILALVFAFSSVTCIKSIVRRENQLAAVIRKEEDNE